ncbi:hypothetical protein EGYY_04260 [Eggerthella sp. YY7918]|nr:hypothetical protein EGYY_04260 [Eggerthella sp. YY7918]
MDCARMLYSFVDRGYVLARIGEELYVADSTMKTHSRHMRLEQLVLPWSPTKGSV